MIYEFRECFKLVDMSDVIKLLTGVCKVLAETVIHLNPACYQLIIYQRLQHRRTATTAGACLGRSFDIAQCDHTCIYSVYHIAFGDVMTGTNGGCHRKRIGTEQRFVIPSRANENRRVVR